MTKEEMRETMKAAPFRPFAVRMADGSRYEVQTPDHVSLSPAGRILVIHVDDVAKILDVALVTEIEMRIAS